MTLIIFIKMHIELQGFDTVEDVSIKSAFKHYYSSLNFTFSKLNTVYIKRGWHEDSCTLAASSLEVKEEVQNIMSSKRSKRSSPGLRTWSPTVLLARPEHT